MSNYLKYLKSQGGSLSRFELLLMRSIVTILGASIFGNMIYNGTSGQILGGIFGLLLVIFEEKRRYKEFKGE